MSWAQETGVRLWSPFARDSLSQSCLAADLRDWMDFEQMATGQPPVPHRFVNLPDGRYTDQINAARHTGEQPHLLLVAADAYHSMADLGRGLFFGSDLMGLWVNQREIAQLPQAALGLSGLWLGAPDAALGISDDYLLLLSEIGQIPLGIDGGPQGNDLGLALALIIEQWTHAFDDPSGVPDWGNPRLASVFDALGRWQREGLVRETDFVALQIEGQELPILNLARYSRGRDLGEDWAFYPLYSGAAGKSAAFLELPLQWYDLRPEETSLTEAVREAIVTGRVFATCAKTASLISFEQMRRLGEGTVMDLFAARQGQVLPPDFPVDLSEWTGLQPDWPIHLANVVRDMRAGLGTDAALKRLAAIYAD